jgi:catechol 2,3-dioxygenase-like lactoylglutathione lyase family enzyme
MSDKMEIVKKRSARALHFVLKVADRNAAVSFYRDLLGMTVLRHEEFHKGCEATCNGPYNGKWSKTMVGFGAEDKHFVVELTYNYTVGSYELGNDFKSLTVESNAAIERADSDPDRWSLVTEEETKKTVTAPGGYQFQLEKAGADGLNKLSKVSLASSNLERSVAFWSNFLGMDVLERTRARVVLSYGPDQVKQFDNVFN